MFGYLANKGMLLVRTLPLILMLVYSFAKGQDYSSCQHTGVLSGDLREAGIDCDLVKSDSFDITVDTRGDQGKSLTVKYLGCGGFYMGNDSAGVLIDPFFSYVNMIKVGVGKLRTIPENVDTALQSIKSELWHNVEGVFAAHSHYDHLQDVPYVINNYLNPANEPKIYSSYTGSLIMRQLLPANQVEELPVTEQNGEILDTIYLNNNSIRVIPVSTNHAPHLGKIALANNPIKQKHLSKFKEKDYSRFWWWKEGQNYSFIVDFLDPND